MAKVLVLFGGKEVSQHDLAAAAVVVGRDESADIRIDNLGISRNHCQFIRRGAAFILQDMNSANGTFVNGKRVGEYYLNDGDRVTLGKYELVFSNETQAATEHAAADSDGLPDTMNTYVMDAKSLKDRLTEMKAGRAPTQGAPATAGSAPVTAAAYAAQRPVSPISTTIQQPKSASDRSLRVALVVSIILNAILLGLTIYFWAIRG